MRFAIDLSAVRTTGTLVYCSGFLPAFAGLLGSFDELILFGPGEIRPLTEALKGPKVVFVSRPEFRNVVRRILWQQTALPAELAALRVDILFEPYDMGPWKAPCPMVLGIRNPNPVFLKGTVVLPAWKRRVVGHLHKLLVSQACRAARLLIFPSAYAADAVGRLLPGSSSARRVVHHGLDTEFWTMGKLHSSQRPYILFASKFYVQKRAALLLEAFASWRERYGRQDHDLIYCGEPRESNAALAVAQRAAELGLAGCVQMRGIVSREEVRALYQGAAQVVLPTVLETFGFPYIEAMAAGIPLVCSDIEIARELCGEVPFYFAADDPSSLAEALESALQDNPKRAAKLTKGVLRSRDFSWQREAEETMACLLEAVNGELPQRSLP